MGLRNGQLDERMDKKRLNSKNLPEPDEETEEEIQRPPLAFLNRQKSAFDSSSINGAGGINSEPSVFDKKAVFRTGGDNNW
ncbi:MAG: hypothetical protein J6C75_01480 [Oscillospiraceae bacterium]|nr:hypothetical protein [Oscillospiraceae bacterium]